MSAIDPNSAGLTAMALSDYISAAWFGPRLASLFLGVLGVIALLLAGVGLYGVMAYSVSQRTREIGIRMALGADPKGVLWMALRRGLLLALSGIGAGLVIALAAAPRQSSGPHKHRRSSAVPHCGCRNREPHPSAASH
jgi:ABC-type antimicrobial peptide transport system permease subunit